MPPMEDKLREAFVAALGIAPSEVTDALVYSEHPAWDSVAHMTLIAAIEEAFGIMIDAQDVIDMSSFGVAKRIVARYL